MSEIVIIAAVAENNVIGKDNDIPWHFSEDLKRFKQLTMGYPVIMGRKTWESMNCKPLPGRTNIVLTRQNDYQAHGCEIFSSLDEAVEYCSDAQKVYIIGGTAIYGASLKIADTLELTRVHQEVEGDAYFPEIDFSMWVKTGEERREGFSYLTFNRKDAS